MLYNLGIFLLGVVMRLAALFHPKAALWVKGRKNLLANIPDLSSKEVCWFHCASLGEYDQAIPVISALKERNPSLFVVLTFYSPSGYENYASRKLVADYYCYIPLDTPRNARAFVSKINPKTVFFVKYEFWNNHLKAAKKNGAEIYLVSGLFRAKHRFFKSYGHVFRKTLFLFDYFFVQNQSSKDLLAQIGLDRVSVSGDTRFDKVLDNKAACTPDPIAERFLGGSKALILGSTWTPDEEILEDLVKTLAPNKPIIIAPHDVKEAHINEIAKRWEGSCVLYTEFEASYLPEKHTILLVNCIGKLSNLYQYGDVAYVGGGFSGSLHNILEPAVFGMPVFFGPKYSRFPEAEAFIQAGFAHSVADHKELNAAFQAMLPQQAEEAKKAQKLVFESRGASQKIVDFLYSK